MKYKNSNYRSNNQAATEQQAARTTCQTTPTRAEFVDQAQSSPRTAAERPAQQ